MSAARRSLTGQTRRIHRLPEAEAHRCRRYDIEFGGVGHLVGVEAHRLHALLSDLEELSLRIASRGEHFGPRKSR